MPCSPPASRPRTGSGALKDNASLPPPADHRDRGRTQNSPRNACFLFRSVPKIPLVDQRHKGPAGPGAVRKESPVKSQFRGRGRLLTLVTAVVAAVTTALSLSLTAGPATASAGPG